MLDVCAPAPHAGHLTVLHRHGCDFSRAVEAITDLRLGAAAAGRISRRDYPALRTLSGVAPVTKRSGKSCIVTMRYAAQVRLRNAVFHWARVAVLNDRRCRGRYEALRARGHSYGRAL